MFYMKTDTLPVIVSNKTFSGLCKFAEPMIGLGACTICFVSDGPTASVDNQAIVRAFFAPVNAGAK